jgi:hypothetical protein
MYTYPQLSNDARDSVSFQERPTDTLYVEPQHLCWSILRNVVSPYHMDEDYVHKSFLIELSAEGAPRLVLLGNESIPPSC